ncbi:hypothetical protein [Caulobacter sp. NIBR1757]|uniref:COG1470 family protein n=1 Tax=Caulobacter sp. NIBR1757 TaxID=3016000 RepID=UPI0022F12CE5|nr:hypothetical protein [Caulobacter sp. NIBR1757]WGM40656.1 hypothetical protein AMEJIAPC_03603 [Caulobacter sp. NIBR1757]
MSKVDLVDWPAGEVLALSGSASSLKIPVTVHNASAKTVRIADASLVEVRSEASGLSLRLEPAPFQMIVGPRATSSTQLRLRLDPLTPPGHYRGEIKVGDLVRPVEIDVLERTALSIRPAPLLVDASLGRRQTLMVAFENRGNTPLTLDLVGSYPLGEEVPLSPQRLEHPSEGADALGQIFNRALGLVETPSLAEVGRIDLDMPNGPTRLEVGALRTEPLTVTLPDELSPVARYHVFAPVYGTDLHLVIVTAAKPGLPGKAKPRKQEKAA